MLARLDLPRADALSRWARANPALAIGAGCGAALALGGALLGVGAWLSSGAKPAREADVEVGGGGGGGDDAALNKWETALAGDLIPKAGLTDAGWDRIGGLDAQLAAIEEVRGVLFYFCARWRAISPAPTSRRRAFPPPPTRLLARSW